MNEPQAKSSQSEQVENAEEKAASTGTAEPEATSTNADQSQANLGDTHQPNSNADNDLLAELEAARADAEKNRDGWQRERAQFLNYKKRVEKERAEAHAKATVEVMKALLPIIDDFERAVANIPADQQNTPWTEGTVAIERKLQRLLEKYDIESIDPKGSPFDPDSHQAIGVDEEAEVESGHVSETLQKGYRTEDTILRPALVRVAG